MSWRHFDIVTRTIFCDQIRREDNGKQIIIGTYAEDYIVPGFPYDAAPLVIHSMITVSPESSSLPTYIRIVVPGHTDERINTDFQTAHRDMIDSGRSVVQMDFYKEVKGLRLVERIEATVYAGDPQGEMPIGRLRFRPVADVVGDFSANNALNLAALELFAGYFANVMPAVVGSNEEGVDEATYRIFQTLVEGRGSLRLSDENQPIWIVAGRRRMWVLYTKAWQRSEEFFLHKAGHPVKFRELERNTLGRMLELEDARDVVDPAGHVVTVKVPQSISA